MSGGPSERTAAGIPGFAEAHGLTVVAAPQLPPEGELLSRDSLKYNAAAQGELPSAGPGTVCHLTYTYRSNDTTYTERRTAVVVRVPETIGFAPYLGSSPAFGIAKTKEVELEGSGAVYAAEETDDGWLAELLSPALSHWLARSPSDFEWELANGVLAVSRDEHLDGESELERLCADAGHIAAALREEALEEVDSGAATRTAAKRKRDAEQVLIESLLPRLRTESPPRDVAEARPAARALVVRHPSTYFIGIFMTVVWTLLVNVIGGGIFGLLLNLPNPGLSVLVFELVLIAVIGFLAIRHEINSRAEKLSVAAFWRDYAKTRDLRAVDPVAFAATHAKAELPGAPTRVFEGTFGGRAAALMIRGDGLTRGDSIALVAGPSGPTASADFNVSAPGPSAKALDDYAQRLGDELLNETTRRAAQAPRSGAGHRTR